MSKFKSVTVMKESWDVTKENVIFLAGLMITLFVSVFIVDYILKVIQDWGYNFVLIVLQVLVSVASVIIMMGVLWIAVKIVRKEPFQISDMTTPLHNFFRFIGVVLLYGFIVFTGIIILIVPGIVLALKYSQVLYLIIDKNLGVLEVFSKSSQMVYGSKMELFILCILLGFLNFAGAIIFGVGLLFTAPLTLVASAFVYNRLLNPVGEVFTTSADNVVLPPTQTAV